MQVLGLYVASFLLIVGFMWWVGGIAIVEVGADQFLFTVAMFLTFEIDLQRHHAEGTARSGVRILEHDPKSGYGFRKR